MKQFITEKHKHLLYKDELNSPFILTKYCEIYKKTDKILGVYCWSPKIFRQIEDLGLNFKTYKTADRLYCFETKVENLNQIIELGAHSRRVYRRGKWLKDKEKRLAHKIIPYNPKLN